MPPRLTIASSLLRRFAPFLALLLLIAITAVIDHFQNDPGSRVFLTPRNFSNILSQCSYYGIVALGMTFVIIAAGIDLSVGSIVALSAGICLYTLNALTPAHPVFSQYPALAVALAASICILAATLMGLLNGSIIAYARLPAFVVTLASMAIFRALILAPAQGAEIRTSHEAFTSLAAAELSVQLPQLLSWTESHARLSARTHVLAFFILAAAFHLILTRTRFGVNVFALGDNARAAAYSGISTRRTTAAVYAIAGLTCGISSLLSASRLSSVASSSLGLFYELDAIAAVVIGGTRLQGGSGRIFATVIGVLILGVVNNMLNILQVSNYYHGLVKGLIILAAVLAQPRNSGGQ